MAEHKHGSMDITDQEKTYKATIKLMTYTAIVAAAVLVFLALVNS